MSSKPGQAAAYRTAGFLLLGGTLHFLAPKFFDDIIPPALPGSPRTYTGVSGAAALATGAGLIHPRTRRAAAGAAVGFLTAVMPAKLQLAAAWCRDDRRGKPAKAAAVAQVFWQIPLIADAARARAHAG